MDNKKRDLKTLLIIGVVVVISLILVYYVVNYFSTGFRTSGHEASALMIPELAWHGLWQ